MSFDDTVAYLYSLQQYGMKFGIDNIRALLSALGNPQDTFRSVHVAGTNGKGSVSSMTESMLRTAGVTTGLFTSPHLVSFTERIRVNGREIPEADVVSLAEEVRKTAGEIPDLNPTFFEVTTAIAFLYFRKMKVEWAVVEVGMGGRLDATNILMPELSIITGVDIDHSEFLGNTLREIAGEKAGIIKEGRPVISAAQHDEVMGVLQQKAAECGSSLAVYGKAFRAEITAEDLTGITIDYHGETDYPGLAVQLAGRHQAMNTAVAVRAIEEITRAYPALQCDVRLGLRNVHWPGRLEFVKEQPPVLIDGAHNPQAASVLAAYLKKALEVYSRIILVMGIMADKDREGIMRPLLSLASEIIFTAPAYGRAASPEMLAAQARSLGYFPKTAPSVSDALARAEELYAQGDLIVVTGSFYTIGEAKEALGHTGTLARLRE